MLVAKTKMEEEEEKSIFTLCVIFPIANALYFF
jgi:hypothetical protein